MQGPELLEVSGRSGVMPVYNHDDIEMVMAVVQACYDSGIRAFEFTNRGSRAEAVFKEARAETSGWDDFALGVGTVLDGRQAQAFIEAGADFIVAPISDEPTARTCEEAGIAWTPGCMTLTEIMNAVHWGASLVKIFPAHLLGPGFVKAVKAPCPALNIMPTGGVSGEEGPLREWFEAGVHCVGLGSSVFKIESPAADEVEQLRARLAKITSFIAEVRK